MERSSFRSQKIRASREALIRSPLRAIHLRSRGLTEVYGITSSIQVPNRSCPCTQKNTADLTRLAPRRPLQVLLPLAVNAVKLSHFKVTAISFNHARAQRT